jgi:hypothetical protein
MSLYADLATLEELATYLGKTTQTLPSEAPRYITRASELVTQAMWNNYSSANDDHVEAAMLATCAQVEYWLEIGESMAFVGNVKELAIGSFKVGFASGGASSSETSSSVLAPRTRSFLSRQGLLYRGV